MKLNDLVQKTNALLAGEILSFEQLKVHFDATIDDINDHLNSCFPTLTEFQEDSEAYEQYPDYDFFPDKYLRKIVILGAAYYFYLTDEEGIETAVGFAQQYFQNLFIMQRDHSMYVPEEFQADDQGSLYTPQPLGIPSYIDDMF